MRSWHYNNEKHVRLVRFELSVHIFVSIAGCLGTFVDEMKSFIILNHYFMPLVLIFWRALSIILHYFLQLTNIIEPIMSHLWVKILRFFLEEEERLFVTYLFLLIDFEFNAPLPNRLEWVKEEREESKSKREVEWSHGFPWSIFFFLFFLCLRVLSERSCMERWNGK